ncbi:LamG domain-containing protein [Granulicella sp. 5B5]|uniref:LamG domain-containing protein n=1 Tax=Granulicella sp. 5B5 TaxID=1617967 RepID=UPI00210284CE|nr:LamG domain-containing protein [Granulicella sp. 5B5]
MRLKHLLGPVLFVATASLAAQMPGGTPIASPRAPEPGLLFYLSGDHGFRADYAASGLADPNYLHDVKILPNGAKGSYLQCGDNQLLSYWAPGNIYSQRGTLAFDWRSRTPVDETQFPIFRVGFGDHSSWDMVWLRIDYNGHGFDAFVTDVNLARTRVSVTLPKFPASDQWTHIALSWDETTGIRFYVNGKLEATAKPTGRFDTALDQFGPNSRIISPQGVESSYNYDRGGDLDELRIYDRALSDTNIAQLAQHETPTNIPQLLSPTHDVSSPSPHPTQEVSSPTERPTHDVSSRPEAAGRSGETRFSTTEAISSTTRFTAFLYNHGWDHPNDIPAALPAEDTVIRKVEINDAYDLKRWWWKGTDGIAETTWPGVYNRSRLPGRYDYFQLPDWDCYALSGKSVTFYMPNEKWNHLEIQGGAYGTVALLTPSSGPDAVADPDQEDTEPLLAKTLFDRPKGEQLTTHEFAKPITGGKVRFTNTDYEWPIQEFSAYYVHPGNPPAGIATLSYAITTHAAYDNPTVTPLAHFIEGRYPAGQRATMIAMPGASVGGGRTSIGHGQQNSSTSTSSAPSTPTTPTTIRYPDASASGLITSSKKEGVLTPSLPLVHIIIPSDFRSLQADEGHGASYTWENLHAGLDGIAIDLPAFNLKPTHGQYIPMNITIKDPLWPMRDMLNFSFSVKPGEPHTLWLDTRDRILPKGQSLYLTIASASPEFSTASLEGAHIRLIFKPYDEALPEHIADRLTQVRDNYANMTEESVNSRKLNLFNRFDADITDLLRVDPTNKLALEYWHEKNPEQPDAAYTPPPAPPAPGALGGSRGLQAPANAPTQKGALVPEEVPATVPTIQNVSSRPEAAGRSGETRFSTQDAKPATVPEWAWLQTRDLAELRSLIDWYVDNRQISDGEMGGGLSDDSDFFEWWPGLAMMGSNPGKLKTSLERGLEAIYNNGMFTNGLATAQYDELHSYEDGLNMLGESMQIDYGNPKEIERAMLTAKREAEWLTGYNSAGQRQIKSAYYSGTKMATGGVWGWAKDRSYFVYHPAILLADYNGNPEAVKMITETADGFLAHRRPGPNGKMQMHFTVNFHTNADLPSNGLQPWFVLWGAYEFTHDTKYLAPFNDNPTTALLAINADALDELHVRDTWGKDLLDSKPSNRRTDSGVATETTNQLKWQLTGDTTYLDKLYTSQLQTAHDREFVNRQGSLWIDRVYFNNGELQRGRLGGVALMRNYDFPGNAVSWRFDPTPDDPTPDTSIGILVPIGTPTHIKIIAYNMDKAPITAQMTGGQIDPGQWEISQCTTNPSTPASSTPAPSALTSSARPSSAPATLGYPEPSGSGLTGAAKNEGVLTPEVCSSPPRQSSSTSSAPHPSPSPSSPASQHSSN